MFMHIFRYRLKKLLRTKEMIFWTLAFPIILATFFNLPFKNLDSSEGFEPAETAVVVSREYQDNAFFRSVLEEVSAGED